MRAAGVLRASLLVQRRAPLLRGSLSRSTRSYCSVDDSLRAALARVAERVRQADPAAELQDPAAEVQGVDSIPGVRTAGPKMILRFTCTHPPCAATTSEEERTTTRLISKHSYEKGAPRTATRRARKAGPLLAACSSRRARCPVAAQELSSSAARRARCSISSRTTSAGLGTR